MEEATAQVQTIQFWQASGQDDGQICSWEVRCSSQSGVSLWFTMLNTERGYDWVKVYDGPSDQSHSIAALTGHLGPNSIQHRYISTENVLFVKFDSDSTVRSQGFEAWYVCTDNLGPIHGDGPCQNAIALQAETAPKPLQFEGTLNIGGAANSGCPSCHWNGKAWNGGECSWLITCGGEPVTVLFESIDTEAHYDYVDVYDGRAAVQDQNHGNLIAALSGHEGVVRSYTSTGDALLVRFASDDTVASTGFTAQYQCSAQTHCHGVVDECGVCDGDSSSCLGGLHPLFTPAESHADGVYGMIGAGAGAANFPCTRCGTPQYRLYNPTRWPQSPRVVMRCAPRESNGPNHLGLCALQERVGRLGRSQPRRLDLRRRERGECPRGGCPLFDALPDAACWLRSFHLRMLMMLTSPI